MKTRFYFLMTIMLSSLLFLSACAPEATPETPLEEEPQETPYPYPVPEIRIEQPSPYPYPEPQEVILDQNDGSMQSDPYPGVEAGGDLDMTKALTSADFAVLPDDNVLQVGPVFIDQSEIVMKESYPVHVELVLTGNLPTPCNKLRVVSAEPDENGHIAVEAYTVSDPDKMCAQMLTPFTAIIPLGEFTEGAFNVSINNEMNAEFELP